MLMRQQGRKSMTMRMLQAIDLNCTDTTRAKAQLHNRDDARGVLDRTTAMGARAQSFWVFSNNQTS